MKLTSELILTNLDIYEKSKKDFPSIADYENETDPTNKRQLWSLLSNFGLQQYLAFADFIVMTKDNNQQVIYNHKISTKEFQTILENCAIDTEVKKIVKCKSKLSFSKLINSDKWNIYSANLNYRRRKKFKDNFLQSTAIVANFCIQNEIEIEDISRVGEFYTKKLDNIDPSIKKEIDLTTEAINFIIDKISNGDFDFRKLNIQTISKSITDKLASKILELDRGDAVKLIDDSQFHKYLSPNKVYLIKSKDFQSGRLVVSIENDLGYTRSYPYRIFETVTNIRDSAIDSLLNDSE